MPRPIKPRYVSFRPIVNSFIPSQPPPWGKEQVILSIEGLEAVRLSDFEGLDHETAAQRMNVSRQTFGRILNNARQVIADGLVNGKEILIQGGSFEFPAGTRQGRRHRHRGGKF